MERTEEINISKEKLQSCAEGFINMVAEHKLSIIETAVLLQVLVKTHKDRFNYEVASREVQADENEHPMADTVWD